MITLDPRVGSKHMKPIFDRLKVPYQVGPLEFGDCEFIGSGPNDTPVIISVEIKGGRNGSDFLTSMQSGRLAGHQAPGLQRLDRRYLIVEGLRPNRQGVLWISGHARRPIFMADVNRYLTGLEETGLRVRRTSSPEHTAHVIFKELYQFWQKPYHEHTSTNTVYVPPVFTLIEEEEALARFRRVLVAMKVGVGAGRSKPVAEHFGSIYAMVNSEVGDWRGIDGIGKKTPGEVLRAVREIVGSAQSTTKNRATGRTPASRVSPRARGAHRSKRTTRKHQSARVDASTGAE